MQIWETVAVGKYNEWKLAKYAQQQAKRKN